MSASHSNRKILADITCSASEPFTPKPLINDILRTRYCIPGSIFLVEGVDSFLISESKRWRGIRLLLGDGELCIQALLSSEMHRYVHVDGVVVGSYVQLRTFRQESTSSEGPHKQQREPTLKGKETEQIDGSEVIYLVVDDLVVVGWNNRLLGMVGKEKPHSLDEHVPEKEAIGRDNDYGSNGIDSAEPPVVLDALDQDADLLEKLIDAEDDFEIMDVPEQIMTQKRIEVAAHDAVAAPGYLASVNADALPWSSYDPTKPLKLTRLRSIPNLPYKQNWSTNVLAVVASISDLEPSTLPPFSQRSARLADLSTSKQVHLTVFLDPKDFTPNVGSVVLLLGVKNHRFDGGSLKKYSSDRPKGGESWWYENPTQFTWCDVEGLRSWWRESAVSRADSGGHR